MSRFTDIARKAAADGIVLLKNDDGVLPLKKDDELAIFGRCQIDYYRSGTGSGGSVNVPYKVNAIDGIKNNKSIKINDYLADLYMEFVNENPFDNGGGGWAAEPWFQKEMPLTADIVSKVKESSNKAAVIIGRTAGEDVDNVNKEGGYLLTSQEMDMLYKIANQYSDVIVILNVANVIDMNWLDDPALVGKISTVLYSWQGGMEGGNALADILSGDITPSGKLPDSIAYHISDYSSDKNFGDKNKNIYEEDIYVGYRYFETFKKHAVRYPFGFGLSYTTFETTFLSFGVSGDGADSTVKATVRVTNTGSEFSGREVVQLYYSAPQGVLGKPAIELAGFKKSTLLKPGESETIDIQFKVADMASYDDSGVTGHRSSYLLEAGEYKIYFGSSVRDLNLIETYNLQKTLIIKEVEEALSPTEEFKRLRPGKQDVNGKYREEFENVPLREGSLKERIESRIPTEIEYTGDRGFKLKDVKSGKVTLDEFIAQLDNTALATLVRGEGMSSPKVTSGTAGAFGGVGNNLLYYGIHIACAADGPSGLRRDSGEEATQVPIGTLLASTWDIDLVYELYIEEGKELVENEIDTLLGPGMNIHRHPLNGRNFEYFSEDPLLTGEMAKAMSLGLNKGGVPGTAKHFAANDQEFSRHFVDAVVSERALREIHLKAFEMIVKEGDCRSIMTAYNPINGIWTASNYDLNTTILRKEWGYTGIVMTDWWAKMNHPVDGGEANIQQAAYMVKAQNDIYMLVNNNGAEVNGIGDDILESVESGYLKVSELQRSAKNILNFILNSAALERPVKEILPVAVPPMKNPAKEAEYRVTDEMKLKNTKAGEVTFKVEEDGLYSLVVRMRHDKDPAAQASSNLFINTKLCNNIQLNGTFGKWVKEKSMDFEFKKGFYTLSIEEAKPGVEFETITFLKQ